MSETLELAAELINRPSLTPDDGGCQELIAQRLQPLGFSIEHLRFHDVDNLWATHGHQAPLLVFLGHTDVVPTGPLDQWHYPPFEATISDGYLWGRGAADMKGGLAAMVTAAQRFVKEYPEHKGTLAFLITSDEEGAGINGTAKVLEILQERAEHIEWCLVGEPSSAEKLADTVKNGRRGSLSGKLSVHGIQGHVAYPDRGLNPIHACTPALNALTCELWDGGNDFFPPTSFQISNIHGGTGADNVIPSELEVLFNFRFSTEVTSEQLKERVVRILNSHRLHYDLEWRLSGQPFLTTEGQLLEAVRDSIRDTTGVETVLSTAGGTSDGRFVAPTGAQVVELGPINQTIHKVNECVNAEDLNTLSSIYYSIVKRLFA